MSISYDNRNKRWRYQFDKVLPNGQRRRTSKLLPAPWDHDTAQKWGEKEDARLYALASGVTQVAQEVPLISAAVKLYLDNVCPNRKDGRHTGQRLAMLAPYYEGKTLAELRSVLAAYRSENAHLAKGTLYVRLAALKAAVSYAYREHELGERDYANGLKNPVPDNARQFYLDLPTMRRFLKAIPDQDARDLFVIAFYTGLRWKTNILTLTQDQIERTNGKVWLKITASRMKNNEPIMVPVPEAAQKALRSIPFANGSKYYYYRFWAARAAIGRPEIVPHDIRHSLASYLVSTGATLAEVGGVLGHRNSKATQRYAHLYPQRRAEIIGKIPKVA